MVSLSLICKSDNTSLLMHLVKLEDESQVLIHWIPLCCLRQASLKDTWLAGSEKSLGSQIAVGHLFPERAGFITGHR